MTRFCTDRELPIFPILRDENKDLLKLAMKGYESYGKVTNFKNYQGLPMPTWDALPEKIKEAWMAAASAIKEGTYDL